MQPTCRRSAQTGAGHGSAAPVRAARSSEFETSRRSRVDLPEDGAGVERQVAAGREAVAGLAVGGDRDREQPAAAGRRAPAERDLVRRRRVDHRVGRRHLGALDRDDRPDDAVLERHRGERVQDDQARLADRVRRRRPCRA